MYPYVCLAVCACVHSLYLQHVLHVFLPIYRLCELNEHIEILDAALDYKSRSIDSHHPGLRVALEHEALYEQSIRSKLEGLSPTELHNLLLRSVTSYTERSSCN